MRLLALSLLALLFAAVPARAQDRGEPVVGGGSFNSAPVLEPGLYRDTILPGEYLYYGFELAAGQTLQVTLTHPDIDSVAVQRMDVPYLAGNIHTPTRTLAAGADNGLLGFGTGESGPLVVSSNTVSAEEDDSDSGAWAGAGVYYLALHAVYRGQGEPPRAEIPFTFDAQVQGVAQPNATPTATPTPTASPTATPTAAPVSSEGSAGPSAAVAAVGGVIGILIGLIAGIRRRRRAD